MDKNGYYNEAFEDDKDHFKTVAKNEANIIESNSKDGGKDSDCFNDINKEISNVQTNLSGCDNNTFNGNCDNKTQIDENENKNHTIGDYEYDIDGQLLTKNSNNSNLNKTKQIMFDNSRFNNEIRNKDDIKFLNLTEIDQSKVCDDADLNTEKRFDEEVFYQEAKIDGGDFYQNDQGKVKVGKKVTDSDYDTLFRYRFEGKAFSSLREPGSLSWRKCRACKDFDVSDKIRKESSEVNRSQYSLVSTGELTTGAVQLWLGLPEEVKYDPALAPFRQIYEKELQNQSQENGVQSKKNPPKVSRLPLVISAPILINNNLLPNEKKEKIKPIKPISIKEEVLENVGPTVEANTFSKASKIGHYIKMIMILTCWMFFTTVFLMYNERQEIVRNTFVFPGVEKSFPLNVTASTLRVELKLSGPFISVDHQESVHIDPDNPTDVLQVWLSKSAKNNTKSKGNDTLSERKYETTKSPIWTIKLLTKEEIDFNIGEGRHTVLTLFSDTEETGNISIMMKVISSDKIEGVPLTLEYFVQPWHRETGVVCATVLLFGLYVLIIFEVVNRTMAAMLVATCSLAVLTLAGQRPSVEEIVSWLDIETLLLLFSMMILVAIMAETGLFDFLAVYTFEVTKGKLWPLITLLCAITAFVSTFLDNVTTVLLMTPVTIRLCEVMGLDPVPILMSMVFFSNIGGTATPVGDPPNVIIASNKEVIEHGINFTNFTIHMALGIVLVVFQTYYHLRFIFRDSNKLRISEPSDIQELRHQISIWRRAADSLPHLSKDVHVVRERLERKVSKLSTQLDNKVKESSKRACPKATFQSTLEEMKAKYQIKDKVLLYKSSVALAFVVTIFFLHALPELQRISLGWTALLGAILLLVLADREDLEPILHRVEWSTLLFFAALFVLMEALSKLGLIEYIGHLTETMIQMVEPEYQLTVAILLLLWVSGISSAFVDNIPLATMMVRVVTSLGNNSNLMLPMSPLIWALAFGCCLGGNGTLIGASANVVCAGVAEQHGYKFTFLQFFKIGFPLMIGHLVCATLYLMICHVAFEWH